MLQKKHRIELKTQELPNSLLNHKIKIIGLESSEIDNLLSQINIIDSFPDVSFFQNVIYLPEYRGLYTQEGKRIDISCLFRKNTYVNEYQYYIPEKIELPKKVKNVKGKHIYMGNLLIEHYGHFLVENVSRLWYLKDYLEGSFMVNQVKSSKLSLIRPSFIDIFLKAIKFKKQDFLMFNEPCLIEEIIVPHPTFIMFDQCYFNHKLIHEYVAKVILEKINIKTTEQPLYFSRTKLKNNQRQILEEQQLEEKLKQKGVHIVYPEKLTLQKQIELINKHEIIIGTIGSAFHGILFDISQEKNIYYLTDKTLLNSTFLMMDAIKSVNSTYIVTLNAEKQAEVNQTRSIDIDMTLKIFKDLNVL